MTEETLRKVAQFAAEWDRRYFNPNPTRHEHFLRKEFRVFLQCLFVELAADPTDPGPKPIQDWLELAKGLDVHDARLEILRRLGAITNSRSFEPFARESSIPFRYPDYRHLIFWRAYHRRICQRSRANFQSIRTADVLLAEQRLWRFYEAMALVARMEPGVSAERSGGDVFDESHEEVSQLLAQTQEKAGEPKILEVGCGDGRLLRQLRLRFPGSELFGTNIFDMKGIVPEVLGDTRTRIINSSVEDLPFEAQSFDIFVSTEVIEHLVNPRVMVEQAFRLLRPGGVFLISAPSKHTQFLSRNPFTYVFGLLSTRAGFLLPEFHNLYEPLTNLPLVHYAFDRNEFLKLFRSRFPRTKVISSRFTHLRKFRMERIARNIPLIQDFGGVLIAMGNKPA